jgi:hypothetical protein
MATGIGYHVHISFTYPYHLEIKIIIFNAINGADFSVESGEEKRNLNELLKLLPIRKSLMASVVTGLRKSSFSDSFLFRETTVIGTAR